MPVSRPADSRNPPPHPSLPDRSSEPADGDDAGFEGGAGVQVIARIPDVAPQRTVPRHAPSPGPRAAAGIPASPADRPAAHAMASDLLAAAMPTWPVAALAVIAVLTWMIASRNEHARLQRQRSEVRMASELPVAPVGSSPGADGGGAVVR